jgi:transcriptional regulator with XRE-family HTH domain
MIFLRSQLRAVNSVESIFMGKITFGVSLRSLRETKSLSRQELADKSGFTLRAIEQWERGEREPSAVALAKLCEALGESCERFTAALLAEDKAGATRKPGRPTKKPRKR